MPIGDEELRRSPRLLVRCRARIRDRAGVCDGETEDLGPRGCRIVTPRPQVVGSLVGLTLASDRVAGVLEVTGQIVWTRLERPPRAGVSFAGGPSAPGALSPAAWFAALAPAEREARSEALFGAPPEIVVEVGEPAPAPPSLVERLSCRAKELLVLGQRSAAEVILRRALALAPGDAALQAALRDLGVP